MEQNRKQKKMITVIVPVYNIEEYIVRCVNSIQNQTYRNLEIILVDDGSTDNTGRVCDELGKKDARIRVFHKENGGSSSARNWGIEQAAGDYIGFVDSDDYIAPFMYEKLMDAIERFSVGIAQIGRREIAEDGTELPQITMPPKQDEVYSDTIFLRELLMHRGDCSFCTKLIDKQLFSKLRFPLGVLNEDFSLLIQMLAEGNSIAAVKECGYFVFYRMGSNTRKESKEQFSGVYGDCVDNADAVMELVKSKYKELTIEAFRFGMFQRNEYLLHIPISQMTKENVQYQEIKNYVRKHIGTAICNPYLTKKNKCYLSLFAICPKSIRKIHKGIKHL